MSKVQIITDEFYRTHIRNIVMTKGNAEAIVNKLKKTHSEHLRQIAESIDDQVKAQGGY